MADGKINRPYGGVLLLGIFLTPLLSLGHDYADGIITAKYFRFAEVVGIGLLLTWMVAWKRNFQFCFRWVDVGVVLFALPLILGQRGFIICPARRFTLRRSMLPEHTAHPPL